MSRRAGCSKVLVVAFCLCFASSAAQQPLQILHNHVRPAVLNGQAKPLGDLPPAQHLRVSLVLQPRDQAGLSDLLRRLYDPSSPDFHKFLSVSQFVEQFAPTAEDYQTVVEYARAQGFTVTSQPANRLVISIDGTVAQVESAFHVKMRVYQHPVEARTFFSPNREPSLALSVPVAHIAGLNNYSLPQPGAVRGAASEATPVATGSGPDGSFLASDMRAAYYGGTALTGTGQTVGLVEFGGYNVSDVNLTFSNVGQTYSVPINNVLVDGASAAASGDDSEQVLDIVQAIGMAPGLSQVRVYIGNPADATFDADTLNEIASEDKAQQVSISWSWSPDDPATDDIFFEEMAAQGQSVFVASGDAGVYSIYELVQYPAEDDYVTAVGGTVLTTNGAGGAWLSETGWLRSGGGISPDEIPIPPWQAGVANASNEGSTVYRNVPDVAMEANTDNYSCDMTVCSDDWGGTSFAAPRWAAYTALANQQAAAAKNPPLGFLSPTIYAVAESSAYGADFHDITSGNDGYTEGYSPYVYYAVPGYDLVTGWGSPNGGGLIESLAPTATMNFLLKSSAAEVTIAPGALGTETITVAEQNGFSGAVTLVVSGLPSGVTGVFGTNPTTASSVLTLTVADSAARGTYLIQVTGTSGSSSASTSFSLQVNAPGFTITPIGDQTYLYPGEPTSVGFSITPFAGFSGTVDLSITSPLLPGVTAFWTPTALPNGDLVLSFLVSDTASTAQDANVILTGTSGSATSSATFEIQVLRPGAMANYSYSPLYLVQGNTQTMDLSFCPLGDLAPSTQLTLLSPSLPSGVSVSFNPQTITASETSVVTIITSDSATPGTGQELGFEEVGPGVETGALLGPTVEATATPFFSAGVTPACLTINQGGTATLNASANSYFNYSSAVTLSLVGIPYGLTYSAFSADPLTTPSDLTLTAASWTPPGFYTGAVAGEGSGIPLNLLGSFGLLVNPVLGFSLGLSASSVTVAPGASGSATVTVTPQNGFNGTVTLSAAGLPSGISLSMGSPTNGTSALTLDVSSSTPAGNYFANITATGGSLTQVITLNVVVPAGVVPVGTTTALSISPSGGSLQAGSSYTLTATVTPSSGTTVPTGSVVFTIGSATQTAALNSSGVATYTGTAPTASGSLSISAAYQGSTGFATSTSNTLSESITTIPTSTALTISPSGGSLQAGSSYTLTATVTPSSGTTVPTGSVVFTIGSATQTAALNSSGVATYTGTAASTATGSLSISAAYQGSAEFGASNSNTLTETVSTSSTTTAASSATATFSSSAQNVTLAATITSTSGTVNAGTVTFTVLNGTSAVGAATTSGTVASGAATVSYALPGGTLAGSYTIQAVYSDAGGPYGTSSDNSHALVVGPAKPSIAWTAPAPILAGTALSATQLDASATGVDGNALAGSFIYSPAAGTVLPAGVQNLTANFTPTDTTDYGKASASVPIEVQDFTLPATGPTVTVNAGQSETASIEVTPVAGWTGTVAFTCSVPSTMAEASCSATSAQVTGASAANSTLTVTTTGPHQVSAVEWRGRGSRGVALGMLFFGVYWFAVPKRRRRGFLVILFAIALTQACLLAGCGGSSGGGGGQTDQGTPAGVYSLSLTASSGSLSNTMQVSVTVQ